MSKVLFGMGSVHELNKLAIAALDKQEIKPAEVMVFSAPNVRVQVDWPAGVYIVRKSDVTENHGLANPAKFPDCCDLNTDGDVECYALPAELRKEKE